MTKRRSTTRLPPAKPKGATRQLAAKTMNEEQEEGSSSNSEHETTPEGREDSVMTDGDLDNQIAAIMQGMQLEEEADSNSGSKPEYKESEQGLQDQVEAYRRKASKKLYLITFLNARHCQATRAIKALRLGSAREKAELCKLDKNQTAIRDSVMNQVKQLEDCGKDAKRMLYAAFKVRLDDITTDSMSTSSSKKKKDSTGTEAPKVDDCIVKWDPSDSVHIAIKAVYKIDHIPIIKGTKNIDATKLKHVELKNQPTLEVDRTTLSNDKDLVLLEIAKRVIKFKEDIKRMLRLHLTDDLFDKVAWSYLPMSLVKIGLAKDYETVITQTPVEDRTWEKAIEALHKSIKFKSVSSKVTDIVTKMHPEHSETMRAFSDRLLPLMEAANMDDSDCSWLVKPLSCYLSDVGMQAMMNKYKSLDNIKSIKEYLEFLHKTPSTIEGNRTDHTAWFLSQFKADVRSMSMSNLTKGRLLSTSGLAILDVRVSAR
ncbi:MAG: hypothetical protein BYD32DRAFT_435435 [Podila humilis]|nr:MAG: hypothetical protein BYD32DRAFT_435435 [Podila humilis]